jgi:hypothetical protein
VTTKKARIREAILARLAVHERDGTLPTTSRFIFYELEARGLATKPHPDDTRPNRRRNVGWPPGSQDITDELTALRDESVIPWSWVADTERSAVVFTHAATVRDYVLERLTEATVNPWGGPPPLILCEDKGRAKALTPMVSEYACPIAGLKGQSNGFLRTQVAQLLQGDSESREVLYLGDLDRSGHDIEHNALRVLTDAAPDWLADWERLG